MLFLVQLILITIVEYAYIDFKKMWSEIPIPDETDLPKALEEGKLINVIIIHWN